MGQYLALKNVMFPSLGTTKSFCVLILTSKCYKTETWHIEGTWIHGCPVGIKWKKEKHWEIHSTAGYPTIYPHE